MHSTETVVPFSTQSNNGHRDMCIGELVPNCSVHNCNMQIHPQLQSH